MTSDHIKNLISKMCGLIEEGQFVPILEADLCGCLYHLLAVDGVSSLARLHLDTRVAGAYNAAQKFDIVIGDISPQTPGLPSVVPEVIIEVKMFPQGFRDSARRVRLGHLLDDDLPKLGSVASANALRLEFIYDEVNYMGGQYRGQNRRKVVEARRDIVAKGAMLVFACRVGGQWQVELS